MYTYWCIYNIYIIYIYIWTYIYTCKFAGKTSNKTTVVSRMLRCGNSSKCVQKQERVVVEIPMIFRNKWRVGEWPNFLKSSPKTPPQTKRMTGWKIPTMNEDVSPIKNGDCLLWCCLLSVDTSQQQTTCSLKWMAYRFPALLSRWFSELPEISGDMDGLFPC